MNIYIVFATLSGHTEELAERMEERLQEAGMEVVVEEANTAEASRFQEFDMVLLGSYTFGDGDVPDDMLDLYDDMKETDLSGLSFAIFGTGDTGYEHFAGAVDHLEALVQKQGGRLRVPAMKADGEADVQETDALVDDYIEAVLDVLKQP
ncbi:flavodoxin domain-containing protein [Alkalicoccus chagannorensis]|uniref:flavodoxin domain-containing protein n=1 Tax=Alkalicoccus chagannorensis TaxID=427072 RepID=UPI0003F8DD17|nr:flavodoxin domain-containing protein [Alkalicoccus chagannorensis]